MTDEVSSVTQMASSGTKDMKVVDKQTTAVGHVTDCTTLSDQHAETPTGPPALMRIKKCDVKGCNADATHYWVSSATVCCRVDRSCEFHTKHFIDAKCREPGDVRVLDTKIEQLNAVWEYHSRYQKKKAPAYADPGQIIKVTSMDDYGRGFSSKGNGMIWVWRELPDAKQPLKLYVGYGDTVLNASYDPKWDFVPPFCHFPWDKIMETSHLVILVGFSDFSAKQTAIRLWDDALMNSKSLKVLPEFWYIRGSQTSTLSSLIVPLATFTSDVIRTEVARAFGVVPVAHVMAKPSATLYSD
jgi:hypothetical protein